MDQIHAGMRGVAYTVFEGVKPESMDVEVLGVLHNMNGPKGDVILARLHGTEGGVHRRGRGHERQPGLYRWQAGRRHRLSHRRILQGADLPASRPSPTCSRSTPWTSRRLKKRRHQAGVHKRCRKDCGSRDLAVEFRCAIQDFANLLKPIETPLVFNGFSEDTLRLLRHAFRFGRSCAGDGRGFGER